MSLTGAASGDCVTEISQTTFAMRLNARYSDSFCIEQPQGDTKMNTNQCDIGLIGLGVMGENLVLNMESKGFSVAVFNRTTEVTDKFAAERAQGKNIRPTLHWRNLSGRSKSHG